MAISLRAAGTPTSANIGIGSVNPAVPAGTTTGDLSVLSVWMKPYSSIITTPAGWTKIGEATNGTVTSGTDVGSTKVAVFVQESAPVGAIGALVLTGSPAPNSAGAVINTYKNGSKVWDYSQFTTGGDTTNAANYSATGAAGIDVATDDWVCQTTAVNGDLGAQSAQAIGGMAGATLGTYVVRQSADTTTGNDSHGEIGDVPITAGSSTSAPTFIYTNTSAGSGTTLWLRLRQVGAAAPKTETLTDDFSGSLDKWPGSYGGVVIEAGQAKIPSTSGYPGMWTNPNYFDLINSSIFAKITVPPGASGTRETSMEVRESAEQNRAMFLYTGDTLYFNTYTAMAGTTWSSVPYNATTMAYWRFSSTGEGNIRFSTSPDGVNWTEQANATVSWSVALVDFLIAAGWYTTGPDSFAYVDNVNVAPVAPPVASFSATATTVEEGGSITFTDTSTNTPTTWAWDFGTGQGLSRSTADWQGPHTITFYEPGTTTVNLTAGNAGGSDAADPLTITVTAAPVTGPSGRPKVNVSGSWLEKPAKVNLGAGWVEKPMKRWNGSAWVPLT